MKIAVYHNLPSGGAKRALNEFVRGLSEDHTIDVYSLSSAEHDFCDLRPYSRQHVIFPFRPAAMLRSPFGRLNQLLRTLDLLRVRDVQKKAAEVIDQGGYDVVLATNCMIGQSPSVLSFLQTPSVYFCNEPPRLLYEPRIPRPYNSETNGLRALADRIDPLIPLYRRTYINIDNQNVRSAGIISTNSAFTRENIYRTYGVSVRVNYLGVDANHFRPLGLHKGGYVLTVGATHPGKGFDFLVRSLALIPAKERPTLMIVTNYVDPKEQAYLADLAAGLGVTIDLRARISDSELVRAYNQALVTVYAPVLEPFGFTPLESQACGTPVVAVAEGGIRESVVDGVTGILTDRVPEKFARALRDLLNDPGLRVRMARHGRAAAETRWTWKRSVQCMEETLVEAASLKRKGEK